MVNRPTGMGGGGGEGGFAAPKRLGPSATFGLSPRKITLATGLFKDMDETLQQNMLISLLVRYCTGRGVELS